jgi:acyl-CoA thioesterase-2
MSKALEDLIAILRPIRIDENKYRGKASSGDGADGTYGGHFLGQATAAALATVDDDRAVHSIHAYFLRAGRPGEPIDYEVDRLRDGRSFCTRRVTASQRGKVAFEMMASFTVDTTGEVIEPEMPVDFDELPEPESWPCYKELIALQDPLPI